mmetsp:Transcript_4047/g.12959  ORF Transcript_4047/g.12959 Transcript_4047/m.12959 type:complete len:140 (-) Transcript_4047:71-490(-)
MELVFQIIDEDQSGTVSYDEFVEQIYMMRSRSSQTLLMFIKHLILSIHRGVSEQLGTMVSELQAITRDLIAHNDAGIEKIRTIHEDVVDRTSGLQTPRTPGASPRSPASTRSPSPCPPAAPGDSPCISRSSTPRGVFAI